MAITLTIINGAAVPPGQQLNKTLPRGGVIGRSPSADWVLIDPSRVISSHHATIEQQGNDYYLTDTSMNGVFVNGAKTPLGKGNRVKLHNGDRLAIGDYEIECAVSAAAKDGFAPQLPEDLFGTANPPPVQPPMTGSQEPPIIPEDFDLAAGQAPSKPLDVGGSEQILDPLKLFDTEPNATPAQKSTPETPAGRPSTPDSQTTAHSSVDPLALFDAPKGIATGQGPQSDFDKLLKPQDTGPTPPDNASALQQQFAPPNAIPDDWLSQAEPPPLAPSTPPPTTETQAAPTTPAPPSPASAQLIAALLDGLQLQHVHVDPAELPELLRTLGQLTRLTTHEMIKTLRARSNIKSDFRVAMTTIRATENNPLKFSASTEEALEKMLIHPSANYLSAIPAVREAFADLQAHQLAVMAGMQAALKAALSRFEPSVLERDCEQRSQLGDFLPGMKKARQWDNFVHYYAEIAASVEEDFGSLFGEEFARVYDEQVARLKRLQDQGD